jgi:hypothetical protein
MRTESLLITLYGLLAIATGASTGASFGQRQAPEARSIIQQVAIAKERGERRIQISVPPSSAPEYKSVNNLDEAISNYAIVIARPVARQSKYLVYTISTWYKFKVIENISDKTFSDRSDHADAPKELLPVQPDEILIPKGGGDLVIDGVEVICDEPGFPQFEMSRTYLLFVKPDPFSSKFGRIGAFTLGPKGVFVVRSDGMIEPVTQQSHALKSELEKLYGNSLERIKADFKQRASTQAALREAVKLREKAERFARRTARGDFPEEYAVYTALIERMYIRKEVELIVINRRTTAYSSDPGKLGETLERVRKAMPGLKPETVADFQSKSNQPSLLEKLFDLKAKVALISADEVEQFFGRGGGWWEAFYKRYPKSQGLLTLSQVGFNAEKNQALVYVGNQRGGLDGGGSYILLTREEDDDWVIADSAGMWIS